jgi:AraC-type DNA-binding domain-containing proteins
MNYNGDLGILLYLPSIICSFCFALALIVMRDRTLPKKYLGISLFLFGLGMMSCFIYERYIAVNVHEIVRSIDLSVTAVGGVLILFYFSALMTPSKLTKKYLATYISVILLYAAVLLSVDNYYKMPMLSFPGAFANLSSPAIFTKVAGYFLIILFFVHIAYIVIRKYKRHRKYISDTYSYEENINLRWVVWAIIAFTAFAMVASVRIANTHVITKILFNVSTVPLLIYIFVYGFRQGKIPIYEEDLKPEAKDDPRELPDHDTSIASTVEQGSGIASDLIAYFEKEKPYLNPELSLTNVADALKVNRTYLSRIINSQFNMNFYTFVNNYRIDHALKIISSHDETKSDTVSLESGFKTRSVFYSLFSKRTGLSPQEYKNKNLK